MMVADVLVPYGHQDICHHHDDLIVMTYLHWKQKIIRLTFLASLMAQLVVITTNWRPNWQPFVFIVSIYDGIHIIIKSPQYTGGDFMFLYRFVRRRRRRPQILVHAITFEQLFGFLSFLAQLLALTCRLPDYILVDFRRDLDLDFSRSNMEFAISQPKLVRLPRNEKQTYRLNSRAQMWPSGLTLAMTLTLNFQGQI